MACPVNSEVRRHSALLVDGVPASGASQRIVGDALETPGFPYSVRAAIPTASRIRKSGEPISRPFAGQHECNGSNHRKQDGVGSPSSWRGCCELRGTKWLFLDLSLTAEERLAQLADALVQDPRIAEEELPAAVHEYLKQRAGTV